MNKKGFTLIELLAVLAIIIIVVGLGAPTLINVLKNNRKKADDKIISIIESAARSYVIDYGISNNNFVCVNELCDKEYLSCPINSSENDKQFNGCVTIDESKNYQYIDSAKVINLKADLDGGSSEIDKNNTYISGQYVDLGTPKKVGNAFVHWIIVSGEGILSGNKLTLGNTDVEVKAVWDTKFYTITYDCNGGIGEQKSEVQSLSSNLLKNWCLPTVKKGINGMAYYFKGWSTNPSDIDKKYDDEALVDTISSMVNNVKLYAIYGELFTINGNYEVMDDDNGNWRVKIKGAVGETYGEASIIFNSKTLIDLFLVGGGGMGDSYRTYGCEGGVCGDASSGHGGGGGYIKTILNFDVTTIIYNLNIGDGGNSTNQDGGSTSAFGYIADGGKSGKNGGAGTGIGGASDFYTPKSGGKGAQEFGIVTADGYGGGGSGGNSNWNAYCSGAVSIGYGAGGTASPGIENTGGGGGGAGSGYGAGAGGSGIIIFRNA